MQRIATGHGALRMEVFKDGVSPRLRLYSEDRHLPGWSPQSVAVETEYPDGSRRRFSFVQREDFLESVEEIPEPHEFVVRLRLGHDGHDHDYDVEFTGDDHTHALQASVAMDVAVPDYKDPHELAHADDIRRRFASGKVTNGQILMLGLTGGLVPCSAAITVLILCLQLKKIALGVLLVLSFSIGLALTLIMSGVLAAVSVRYATKRLRGFGEFTRKLPYFSGGLILLVGLYIGYQGCTR